MFSMGAQARELDVLLISGTADVSWKKMTLTSMMKDLRVPMGKNSRSFSPGHAKLAKIVSCGLGVRQCEELENWL